ncbi:MAG: CZB domain-containing protein [Hydrogenophaga sp.]|nr:CZB domain-containing protein [Hydrogenophaga sp.]
MAIFRRFFGAEGAVHDHQLQAEAAGAAQGLDIDAAVIAHQLWKQHLLAHLAGHPEAGLDVEEICRDDRCDLGRWIHGPARARLGTFPGFTALLSHHRMFHHVACNVLALEQAGKRGDARRMVADQFEAYSDRVTEDLRLLQQVVNQSRTQPGRAT